MEFFELITGIGLIGTCISFAATMYLERKDSIEEKLASGSTFFFLIVTIAGLIGTFL